MSAVEGDWEVSVQGRDSDLRYLATHFATPPMVVVQSDADGRYVLRLDAFCTCSDSTEVLEVAERELVILSGILKLERSSTESLQTGAVFRRRNGGRDVFVHVRDTLKVKLEMGEPTVTVTDSHGNPVPRVVKPPRSVRIAAICARESAVAKAMRLFAAADARTWVGLYRIFEVIESDVGGQVALGKRPWGSVMDLERFKRSANSVTVAGDEARHGKEHTVPPKNPMTLEEAGAYVEQLVRRWLEAKGV